jgi:hypothetical protein
MERIAQILEAFVTSFEENDGTSEGQQGFQDIAPMFFGWMSSVNIYSTIWKFADDPIEIWTDPVKSNKYRIEKINENTDSNEQAEKFILSVAELEGILNYYLSTNAPFNNAYLLSDSIRHGAYTNGVLQEVDPSGAILYIGYEDLKAMTESDFDLLMSRIENYLNQTPISYSYDLWGGVGASIPYFVKIVPDASISYPKIVAIRRGSTVVVGERLGLLDFSITGPSDLYTSPTQPTSTVCFTQLATGICNLNDLIFNSQIGGYNGGFNEAFLMLEHRDDYEILLLMPYNLDRYMMDTTIYLANAEWNSGDPQIWITLCC